MQHPIYSIQYSVYGKSRLGHLFILGKGNGHHTLGNGPPALGNEPYALGNEPYAVGYGLHA